MVSLTRPLLRNWSKTLKLPTSTFPARATAEDLDKYRVQCTKDLYDWQCTARKPTDDLFILHDGPPYANGHLHIGHAVNKILKDIINRIQVQKGRSVHYQPGWDCHGLPIELKALESWQELGEVKRSGLTSPVAIRHAARKLADITVTEQSNGFQEWGVMGHFDRHWKTMDKSYVLSQLRVFREMVKKNLIVRRFKPVFWSPASRTALAEAELEFKEDHESKAAYVRIPLSEHSLKYPDGVKVGETSLVIWTTTPWTLPANKAIAVNANMTYVVVTSAEGENLVVAKSRLKSLLVNVPGVDQKVLFEVSGAELAANTFYRGIFAKELSLPVLTADFVTADSGTGVVHCAPGHGMDDYELCRNHNIEAFAPVDDEGRFTHEAEWAGSDLAGKSVLDEGNIAVLEYLQKSNHLLNTHKYRHKYPYDWRSKTPVIVRATQQWFADLGPIRDQALNSLKGVTFIPESGRSRLESFVRHRSEWCISRQRAWGVPIPALYHKDTGEALLDERSVSHILTQFQIFGIEGWFTDAPDDPRWTPFGIRESKEVTKYRRGMDTMDVWFDSGTSWTQALTSVVNMDVDRFDKPLADVYIEGTDQHRGWFQSSLLTRIAYQAAKNPDSLPPQPPFKTLITHGFTLDSAGRKMSKSVGNVISPWEIVSGAIMPYQQRSKNSKPAPDPLGPDALRLFVASSDYTKDITISPDLLKSVYSTLTRLRMTFKLLLGALSDFNSPHTHTTEIATCSSTLTTIDRIALHQLCSVYATVQESYSNLEFHKAITAIAKWVSVDFSAQYMESVKDRLYCDSENSVSRRAAQRVLFEMYLALTSMLAPLTPLLVQESIVHAPATLQPTEKRDPFKYPHQRPEKFADETLARDIPALLSAKSAVKTAQEVARNDKQLRSSLECSVHIGVPDAEALAFFQKYLDDQTLEQLFVVSNVSVAEGITIPQGVKTGEWSHEVEFTIPGLSGEKKGKVWVTPPKSGKCVRCWRYKVKEEKKDEALCQRCEGVVEGKGTYGKTGVDEEFGMVVDKNVAEKAESEDVGKENGKAMASGSAV
jgi:isoleucyl-tRNA synthetase